MGRLNQINYIIIPSDKQLVSVRSLCLYEFSREKKQLLSFTICFLIWVTYILPQFAVAGDKAHAFL